MFSSFARENLWFVTFHQQIESHSTSVSNSLKAHFKISAVGNPHPCACEKQKVFRFNIFSKSPRITAKRWSRYPNCTSTKDLWLNYSKKGHEDVILVYYDQINWEYKRFFILRVWKIHLISVTLDNLVFFIIYNVCVINNQEGFFKSLEWRTILFEIEKKNYN